jgi:hypothetical protein
MDERNVDRRYCGVDIEGDKYWIACNVGIGAMLHEVGHLFGCPHQRNGIMMRDYIRLNRSFCVIEPSGPPALNGKECSWHRLDLLRFRAHTCFALPDDLVPKQGEINIFGIDQGVLIQLASPIVVVEVYLHGDEFPKSWIEYVDQLLFETILSEHQLRSQTGEEGRIKINVIALNGTNAFVDDVAELLHVQQVPELGKVWKSAKLGLQTGSPSTVLFSTDSMVNIRVYSGLYLDGVEFFTEQESFFFGKRGGSPHDFLLENNEFIIGFRLGTGPAGLHQFFTGLFLIFKNFLGPKTCIFCLFLTISMVSMIKRNGSISF